MVELILRNVWFRYPGSEGYVLKNVTFELRGSELAVIKGPNGSGKSTLLLVAAGLLRPERGDVLLDGAPLETRLPQARKKIGVTFQDPDDQFFNATVYNEIAFALRQLKLPEEEVEEAVVRVAKTLQIEGLLKRSPYRLSGGEKVKVALASVLVYDPEILLLDEPTAYLTGEAKARVLETILSLKNSGKAVAVTTNDPDVMKLPASIPYILAEGMLVRDWMHGGSVYRLE